jgi:hypothetical protein
LVFSLIDLLATNATVPRGLSLVVLKSFFDAGNQANSCQYEVLSLAVMSGTHDLWVPFDKDWKRILKKHKADHLHTTYAVSRKGIYKGWTEGQRDAFLKDCVSVAAKHCARAKIGEVPGKYGINCFVVSFVLKDFVDHAKRYPEQPQNVNESCLRQALPELLNWCKDQAACEHCHCFFDQGEPFYGILSQILQSKQAIRDAWLLKMITHRSESDMRFVPALQLADLYAWCQSHRNSTWQPKWKAKLLRTHFRWQWLDKSNLDNVEPGSQEVWRSWNLPKLASTK